ncbi:MAG TPA: pitrilysin family protein [Bryobacteraceae bacterium]|jgi:zinc protease|nr:pitrilysin family protein [Bryobacteraceae bacterium]
MSKRSLVAFALFAFGLAAQTVDRAKPPQTGPIPGYKLPPVFETKLPNGLAVVLVEDSRFPLVTARLNFQGGSKYDSKDIPGLAEAVGSLLTEGTKTRTARQLSEETDAIGGSLSAGAGADGLTLSGGALSEHLTRLLVLMADVSRNANFPQDEVNLFKQNRIQNLMSQRSDPGFLAEEKMAEVVYGSSPYAHIAPTEASIGKLDPKVLATFRDTYLVPNNATLIVIGKLPARAELMKTITDQLGSWQQKPLPPSPKMDPPAPKRQIVLVDRPGSVQADIHVGRLAPTRLTPEYFPLMVGNTILGGGANSRMFKNIREKEGFAYDAHSQYDTHRDAGDFEAVTQVRNDVIEPALKAVLAELDRMSGTPVAADELTDIKNYISGLYLLRLETQDGLANQLNNMKILGLPNDYLETYTTRVRSVEPDQVLSAAKKYMAPGQAAVVVVGDASKIGDTLKKFGDVTVTKAN